MLTFTLDSNCIIDVDEGRPQARWVLELADAHAKGQADVSVTGMSASERQQSGGSISEYDAFEERLRKLGLSHLGTAMPLAIFDMTFWDNCILAGPREIELERQVHSILFPSIPQDFLEFCRSKGLDARVPSAATQKWNNAMCDVHALLSHIIAKRDVFVTSDANFFKSSKLPNLLALGAGKILNPEQAVNYLRTSQKE